MKTLNLNLKVFIRELIKKNSQLLVLCLNCTEKKFSLKKNVYPGLLLSLEDVHAFKFILNFLCSWNWHIIWYIFFCSRNIKIAFAWHQIIFFVYIIYFYCSPILYMSCQKIINFIINVKNVFMLKLSSLRKCKRNLMGVQYMVANCYTVFSMKNRTQYNWPHVTFMKPTLSVLKWYELFCIAH